MTKRQLYYRKAFEWALIYVVLPVAALLEQHAPWALTVPITLIAGLISREGVGV
jgi:hypothetical protein